MKRWHLTLLKLFAFSIVYGLFFINWIDLFNVTIPAYHIWFLSMLFMPFFISVIFYGKRDIELFVALGLMSSLMNDVFYFAIGDALFSFHVALIPWWANQFGLNGWNPCFVFQGGFFHFTVVSWMMGSSIYARIVVVGVILRQYWKKWLSNG